MASMDGKVIAITGAASGIGLTTAKLLASRGAVLSLADVNAKQLEAAASSIEEGGAKVIYTVVDVRDRSQVNNWIERTVKEFGRLDGAANLAGVVGRHAVTFELRDETDDEWDFIMNVNTKGVFNCMREELNVMKSGASIVNAASVLAVLGQLKSSIYCASKHAVAGLIRAGAKEEAKNNIRINGVAPGFIDTPMVTAVEKAQKVEKPDLSAQAMQRKGRPEEIAAIVAFLLSDESTFVTGAIWSADGASNKAKVTRRQHSQQQKAQPKKQQARQQGQQQVRVKVPFIRNDNVLLVGEGDFSFSLALKQHHKVGQILATCYDSKEELKTKYPESREAVLRLARARTDDDSEDDQIEWKGFSPSPHEALVAAQDSDAERAEDPAVTVLYEIDATKLSSVHRKALRASTPFTKIVFNFPHVGGRSTDVNRQVRYNQELLVGFFNAAKPLLSSPSRPARPRNVNETSSAQEDVLEEMDQYPDHQAPGDINGQILVTLFEGEPYTLWNIRDLARHCGLKIVESFRFPWSAYPGYQHARTVGDITIGKDRSSEGKRKGAWRGEERDARCYVLEDKNAPSDPSPRKKRKKGDDGDSD
ncbi:hypothetical protein H2200_011974 [Cladophialophora chaetospira]|uniref:25S rRNA (uridine-N(3))-methyltransferase BMT5-like domain-containing protein n=1 Tax=Cladophialophora chaetospira TaxID=386627 RepID=A0AA39CD05_9EURO|nr:hypothetical protein H2200_011974 [Cladophialophora chaetospira]